MDPPPQLGANLPLDMVRQIAAETPWYDLPRLCRTSRGWARLCRESAFWRARYHREFGEPPPQHLPPSDAFWRRMTARLSESTETARRMTDGWRRLFVAQYTHIGPAIDSDLAGLSPPVIAYRPADVVRLLGAATNGRDYLPFFGPQTNIVIMSGQYTALDRRARELIDLLRHSNIFPAPVYTLRDYIWLVSAIFRRPDILSRTPMLGSELDSEFDYITAEAYGSLHTVTIAFQLDVDESQSDEDDEDDDPY